MILGRIQVYCVVVGLRHVTLLHDFLLRSMQQPVTAGTMAATVGSGLGNRAEWALSRSC